MLVVRVEAMSCKVCGLGVVEQGIQGRESGRFEEGLK